MEHRCTVGGKGTIDLDKTEQGERGGGVVGAQNSVLAMQMYVTPFKTMQIYDV